MSVNQEVQSLKLRLKKKWIDYYQSNKEILDILDIQEKNWDSSDDDNSWFSLPKSDFIIGILLAIEPSLKEELKLFTELTSDCDTLVKVLKLNFDVKSEIEKLSVVEPQQQNISELDDIREQIKLQNGEIT